MFFDSAAHTAKSFTYLKLFMFFVFGTLAIILTYFPIYLQDKGFDKSAVGMLMAGGPFISIMANPFWAYWSDRTQNIRRILLIMLTGNFFIVQAVFQLDQYVWIYIGMLLLFMFQTPLLSQTNSLILDSIQGTAYKFGAFRLWGSFGWAIIALGTAPIIERIHITNLWMIYSVMMVVTIGLCLGIPRGGAAALAGPKPGIYTVMRRGPFLYFLLTSILISTPNGTNSMFFGLYITEMGGSSIWIGWAVFLGSVLEVPIFILLDRYFRKDAAFMLNMLVIVSGLFAVRWLLMSLVTEPWQIMTVQMMHCITFGVYYYVGTNLTTMFVPPELRASGQAVYTLAWNGISGMTAGFAGGFILDAWGFTQTYRLGVVLAIIGACCFLIMRLRVSHFGKDYT